ncbi:MAG: hypothetical protein V1745_01665 [Patescibacteria group bacterium]
MIIAHVPDLRDGQKKHGCYISFKRLRDFTETYGHVVRALACVDARALEDFGLYSSIIANGFDPIAITSKRTPNDAMPGIQNPSPLLVTRDAKNLGVRTVVIVSTNGLPAWVYSELKEYGIRIVMIAPDPSRGVRPAYVDEWISITKIVDSLPLPAKRYADDERPIERYLADVEDAPTHEMERLERDEPEAYAWLERILTVTEATHASALTALQLAAARGSLPGVALAALIILSDLSTSPDAEPCVRKNLTYQRFARYGIDIDTVGRLAIKLLIEEGTLVAEKVRRDTDYLFANGAEHPAHRLGRAFCSNLTMRRNRLAFTKPAPFADGALEAFEIFSVAPADLTSSAAKDMCDLFAILLRHADADALKELVRKGVPDEQDAERLLWKLEELVSLPPDITGEEEGDEAPSVDRPSPSGHLIVVSSRDLKSA